MPGVERRLAGVVFATPGLGFGFTLGFAVTVAEPALATVAEQAAAAILTPSPGGLRHRSSAVPAAVGRWRMMRGAGQEASRP